MGFWIFMLVMNLLIPATMAGFGRAFLKKPQERLIMPSATGQTCL